MNSFNYYNPARIVFGKDSEKNMEQLLKDYNATSVLMVYSGEFVKTLGIYKTVEDACKANGADFYECGKVVPNPKIELIRELVTLGKEKKVDFIVAVGGGSAIDTAKAVSLGIPYAGDVWDFFDGKATPGDVLPFGVISTIPASGSETSNAAIISNGIHKVGFEDNKIISKFAIMNPTFTRTLPAYQTSCGVADILSHLVERYFSITEHVDTTDYLIEGAVQAVMVNGERLMVDPTNMDARSEVMWLASIAHNNLLDTGRTPDWASHRIEHELSAQYGITHGEGMAVILVAYVKYMSDIAPKKMAQLANRVFNVDYTNYTEKEMALKLADEFEKFFRTLKLKTTLTEMGIDDSKFVEMANRATNNDKDTVGHYIPLNVEKFVAVLKMAL